MPTLQKRPNSQTAALTATQSCENYKNLQRVFMHVDQHSYPTKPFEPNFAQRNTITQEAGCWYAIG